MGIYLVDMGFFLIAWKWRNEKIVYCLGLEKDSALGAIQVLFIVHLGVTVVNFFFISSFHKGYRLKTQLFVFGIDDRTTRKKNKKQNKNTHTHLRAPPPKKKKKTTTKKQQQHTHKKPQMRERERERRERERERER